MVDAFGWAVRIVGVVIVALLLTFILRRPRLVVEVSMRGTTRSGKLYVVATNRGGLDAPDARVEAAWVAPDGRRASIGGHSLGTLAARDAVRVEIDQLHRGLDEAAGWEGIEVALRAKYALPSRARVSFSARTAAAHEGGSSVIYVSGKAIPCPDGVDGRHEWEERRIENDGVTETWELCKRCRHVQRHPLSDADKAVQARVRAERARRERVKLEEEFERLAREESPRQRASGHTAWKRDQEAEKELARDVDTFPPDVAFYVLELDPARASWEDVLAAHRRLALAHHPDRRQDRDAAERLALERKMQEINVARDRLREHFGVKVARD